MTVPARPVRERSPAERHDRREIAALAIVWVVVLLVLIPSWMMTRGFFIVEGGGMWFGRTTQSLWYHVRHGVGWAVAVGTLHLTPLWYAWWRRSGMAFGGLIGVALSLASAAALWMCIADTRSSLTASMRPLRFLGYHPMLVVAAVAFAAAFLIAPPPRDREAMNELSVKSLVRRHRKEVV